MDMPDPFEKPPEEKKSLAVLKRIFRVGKVILTAKFPMNLLFLIVIIVLCVVGFEYLQPDGMESVTGNVILEEECPACVCEEVSSEECEQDCDLCPIRTKVEKENVIYYSCPGGELVTDLEECEDNMPELPNEYVGTVEGVSLIIDNIEYEKDEEDSGFVTRVDYTIINKGDLPLVPKLEAKVYKEWTLKVKKTVANKVINPEIVVNPGEWLSRKDRVRIYFKGEEQTLRLLLVDSLPTIERDVVAVTRDFELDYAD